MAGHMNGWMDGKWLDECIYKRMDVSVLFIRISLWYHLVYQDVRETLLNQLTCIRPSLRAGPSSARRRMYRPMLYSFPPLRLKPKPL